MSSESSENLKAKLRTRRLQMDNTLQKKESTKIDFNVHDESAFETSAVESLAEDDNVTELKSELEHRREKSRRLLEKEERESILQPTDTPLAQVSKVLYICDS